METTDSIQICPEMEPAPYIKTKVRLVDELDADQYARFELDLDATEKSILLEGILLDPWKELHLCITHVVHYKRVCQFPIQLIKFTYCPIHQNLRTFEYTFQTHAGNLLIQEPVETPCVEDRDEW
jgi:hypothetical protein